MAKKERKDEIVFSPADDSEVRVTEEEKPMYETEAYGSPKPDAGSEVTVMKQVGIGGPVPIVAPKHNTIQLQPIVVPLAVVPYMTQDSNVLRTDGKQQTYEEEEYNEAAKFDVAKEKKKKIKNKESRFSRLFAFITMLISLIVEIPFIISYFGKTIGGENLDYLNIIKAIETWVGGGTVDDIVAAALFIGTFAFAGITALVALLSLIFGKYPRAFFGIFTFVSFGSSIAVMIIQMFNGVFDLALSKILIALISVTGFSFVLSIVFSMILNSIEDKKEKTISEI
ncbi:MAG: hypothetical protein MJ068_00950 [Clostridia bacterium]|nr:hypothetical protein [Clostridia bacterium]